MFPFEAKLGSIACLAFIFEMWADGGKGAVLHANGEESPLLCAQYSNIFFFGDQWYTFLEANQGPNEFPESLAPMNDYKPRFLTSWLKKSSRQNTKRQTMKQKKTTITETGAIENGMSEKKPSGQDQGETEWPKKFATEFILNLKLYKLTTGRWEWVYHNNNWTTFRHVCTGEHAFRCRASSTERG